MAASLEIDMGADQLLPYLLAVLGGGAIAGAVFFVVGRRVERRDAERVGRSAAQQAERILSEARRDADQDKTQLLLGAKEEILQLRQSWDAEAKERREELERHQERVEERETLIDRKLNTLDDRAKELDGRERALAKGERDLASREVETERLLVQRRERLEEVARLSATEAKKQLREELVETARSEAAAAVRDIREETKRTAEREAKKIIALAVQRV
ncbi:MAG: Rnase Y domain-containing protein, partial [Myxococcales bacterium]|nr:Rnase Y domain-containing protein [Myxococcales bacterium]